MSNLKPCPFCGGTDVYVSARIPYCRVICITPQCIYGPAFLTEKEAVDAWNTRTTPKRASFDATWYQPLIAESELAIQQIGAQDYSSLLSLLGRLNIAIADLCARCAEVEALRKRIDNLGNEPTPGEQLSNIIAERDKLRVVVGAIPWEGLKDVMTDYISDDYDAARAWIKEHSDATRLEG